MNALDISNLRLLNQQIATTNYNAPKDIVYWLGAMQAQDYNMAKWAIGARLPQTTEQSIQQSIDKGEILRTHVLRPTWHFVSPKDIRWMLAISAPRLRNMLNTMCRNLELDDKVFKKTNSIIQKSLIGKNYLTREELMSKIQKAGILTNELRAAHIMFRAELEGLVCSGPMQEKKITYSLLEERVPSTKKIEKEEALGMLALRYFKSHGPATLSDFIWWSGLTTKDARDGLKMNESKLISEKIGEQTYWFSDVNSKIKNSKNSIHFLPAFDEFIVSYKDRSASLDLAFNKKTITLNGIFKPIIVINGKVEGIWKRTSKKDYIMIENQFFSSSIQSRDQQFRLITKRLENFFGTKIKMI